jgi:hypothetical protein
MEYSNSQYRRRVERISLSMPVRIEAKESKDSEWNEITRFSDVSSCGAGFELKHPVKVGQLLLLTAPIPQKLRRYDFSEHQYKIWSLVRHCVRTQVGDEFIFQVGVAFIGKYPPLSYQENPGKLYSLAEYNSQGFFELKEFRGDFTPTEIPLETPRQNERYPIPIEIFLEALDQNKNAFAYETTVSENISVGGASVFASLDVKVGDFMRVNFIGFNISIVAKVCNRRVGADQMPRLHLQFIDRQLPLEGIV